MNSFLLKVRLIEKTCTFELSWGKGQQLSTQLTYPEHLTELYKEWQWNYLNFYNNLTRGRVEDSGSIFTPPTDWRTKLVQAEAQLVSEFQYWLNSAELMEIRQVIASGAATVKNDSSNVVDVFLTCEPLELARFPWEAWQIGTEFAATKTIRISRTPANMRLEAVSSLRRGRMRILAIMGDDTGLNFYQDRKALESLSKVAEIEFIGWQPGDNITDLKAKVRETLADTRGWDVLFFAGHSNETDLTGGELAIAPNESILISEIAPQLKLAKDRGLQFAIFNSCNGLSIANALIDLGLSQVAVMREPIHNCVAQEFSVRFVQGIAEYKDVHEALELACQHFKVEKNLTYPSAYLIPSLFRHPDTKPFRLQPFGLRQQLKQWLPNRKETVALAFILFVGLYTPVQDWLMEHRVLMQAVYRQFTGQVSATASPQVLLVQIDENSIKKTRISQPVPINRNYLAQLVDKLNSLDAKVVGIDYLLDRYQDANNADIRLNNSLQKAVKQNQTWFIFAARKKHGKWDSVLPEIAKPNWSLSGDIWVPFWYVKPLPWLDTSSYPLPFSYNLAIANRLTQQQQSNSETESLALPQPNLQREQDLQTQVKAYINKVSPQKGYITERMRLQTITALSYKFNHRWLQPILDFSIPPNQIYETVPAWQLLEEADTFLQSRSLKNLQQSIIIIAPGGYDEAGIGANGEDNFPLPAAVGYWRNQQQTQEKRGFTGGEAHAYMTHHFLTHRLVIPIPDIWMILTAALMGKGLSLMLIQHKQRWFLISSGLTILYGLLSLQLYISAALLLPWVLPSTTFWIYILPQLKRKNNV
jgi:hypothetical protein